MNVSFARSLLATLVIISLLPVAASAHSNHGTYRADTTSFFFTDTSGQKMPGIVYYPYEKAHHQPLPAGQTYPAVIFMQGGNVDAPRYSWLKALAEEGYIVIMPDKYPVTGPKLGDDDGINTNTKLTTVDVLNSALIEFHTWAADSSSPVYNLFDGQVAVAGHSLGAVMAMYAVDEVKCNDLTNTGAAIAQCPIGYTRHPSIAAMWLIGGHLENPYGPADPSMIYKPANFPIYMLAGDLDGHSTVDEVQTSYRRYQSPKIYYEIQGANHLNWVDYLHPEDGIAKDFVATIHPQEQKALSIDAILAFMDCNLKNKSQACSNIPTTPVPPPMP